MCRLHFCYYVHLLNLKMLIKQFEFMDLNTSTNDLFTRVLESTIKHLKKKVLEVLIST